MSIPTDITYTGLTANFDLNPASDRNFAIDLRSSQGVNRAINDIKGQMLDQNWTLTGEYFPTTTLYVGGLIGSSSTGFSHTVLNWTGSSIWDIQFFTSPEPDPSGNPGLLPGTIIWGLQAVAGDTQAQLLAKLAAIMTFLTIYPFVVNVSTTVVDTIVITSLEAGTGFNDLHWRANLTAGFTFAGPMKGGGWELTSLATAEHSPVVVTLRNVDTSNYLHINSRINGNDCTEIIIERRNNYLSVVSPFMWCLFRLNDGSTYSSGDTAVQYDDYLICAPEMDAVQRADPDDPLTFTAFVLIGDRGAMNQSFTCVTAINGSFRDSGFSAFNSDMGVSLILLNSMQTAAGALTTTADKYLQIQALIGLSPDAGEPLQVVGNLWDMYLVSKYFPLDTLAFSNTGKLVIAYRSQQAPCEWTLFLALN